ncbi:hypothetical protein [Neobacillus sp. Marseille-QA0830]
MYKQPNEKEKLMAKLAGIYDQLEELDGVLEASFSDRRDELDAQEQGKIAMPARKLSALENIYKHSPLKEDIIINPHSANVSSSLKLELGF